MAGSHLITASAVWIGTEYFSGQRLRLVRELRLETHCRETLFCGLLPLWHAFLHTHGLQSAVTQKGHRLMQQPLGTLEFLYIGTAAFERDCGYYRNVLGAELVWAFHAFDAKVGAFRLSAGPLFLLADHRPAPSCMPIIAVLDLEKTVAELKQRGWQSDGDSFEIPNGPCYRFTDPSGNQMAIFQNMRPERMEQSFADKDNPNALRL